MNDTATEDFCQLSCEPEKPLSIVRTWTDNKCFCLKAILATRYVALTHYSLAFKENCIQYNVLLGKCIVGGRFFS